MEIPVAPPPADGFNLDDLDTVSRETVAEEVQEVVPRVEILLQPPPATPGGPSTSGEGIHCYLNPVFGEDETPRGSKGSQLDPVVRFMAACVAGVPEQVPPDDCNVVHNRTRPVEIRETSNDISWRKTLFLMKQKLSLPLYLYVVFDVIYSRVEKIILFDVCWLVLHLAMLAMSMVYLNDCKAQRHIPIYLLEVGLFGSAMNMVRLLGATSCLRRCSALVQTSLLIAARATHAALILCWIVGLGLVYSIFPPETQERNDLRFCDFHLYYFAFAFANVTLIMMVAFSSAIIASIVYYYRTERN